MKISKAIKAILAVGFVMGIYFGQPMSASAAEVRQSRGDYPYQVSLRSSAAPTNSADDVVVDGRIITAENP